MSFADFLIRKFILCKLPTETPSAEKYVSIHSERLFHYEIVVVFFITLKEMSFKQRRSYLTHLNKGSSIDYHDTLSTIKGVHIAANPANELHK